MSDANTYEGEIVKHPNSYKHVCPNCNKIFYGRKNKKFCSIQCKYFFHNAEASVKRQRIASEVSIYSQNESFLNDHCMANQDVTQISILFARMCGFTFGGPYKCVKDKFDGKTWYVIGNFEYRVISNADTMLIRKSHNK